MFNTVVAGGYGNDSSRSQGATQIRQSSSDGCQGMFTDRSWSDSNGCPTVPINSSASVNVMNFEGSYTPTGATTASLNNYYGSGMWLSSPVGPLGEPVVGCGTLAAGATFQMSFKIVATQQSQAQFRTQSGWGSTTQLNADSAGNIASGGQHIATNGVAEALSWSPWSNTTTTWKLNSGTT